MPWQERDWAKWSDEERNRYLGTSGSWRSSTGGPPDRVQSPGRPNAGEVGKAGRPALAGLNRPLTRHQTILAFGLIAVLVAYAIHHAMKAPTASPASILPGLTPALAQPHPVPAPQRVVMRDLPSTLRRGTYVTSSGTLGTDVSGAVIVEGRWETGPWYRLATAPVTNGSYRVRYLLDRPGLVHLRIALPNGNYLVATTRVS